MPIGGQSLSPRIFAGNIKNSRQENFTEQPGASNLQLPESLTASRILTSCIARFFLLVCRFPGIDISRKEHYNQSCK